MVLAAFLALFLLPVLYYGSSSEMARWNAARAQLQFDTNDVETAINTMKRALDQSPNDHRLKLKMSKMLMTSGHAEKALELIDKVLELDPDSTNALALRADGLIYAGQPDEALAVTKQRNNLISQSRINERNRLNTLAYIRALAGEELGRAMSDISRATGLLERDRWWAEGQPMPLIEQNLVAAAIVSRQTGQQALVLKYFDERIGYLENRLQQKEFNYLGEIYWNLKEGVPFSPGSVEQTRWEMDVLRAEKLFLAILLSVRGLVHQDLGNIHLQDLDRKAVQSLGHYSDQLLSILPDDWQLLMYLDGGARILDTRGLVRHAAGRELSESLHDFDIAILSEEIVAASFDGSIQNSIQNETGQIFRRDQTSHFQAVMLKHRSAVYRSLGRLEEAETDIHNIEQLGFDINEPLF